jgi:hypothetical protein
MEQVARIRWSALLQYPVGGGEEREDGDGGRDLGKKELG